ncbi:tRNA(adenine34) deaminase, partial [Candidatus Gastranaerophilus sp. (ex Termes propinquus)]
MQLALKIATITGGDVPVGCIIVKDGEIVAMGKNEREINNDLSGHAEIVTLRAAAQKLGRWQLEGCEMYVTLEPCPMCAWAILNARVSKLYFGAYDVEYGAL